MRMTVPSRTRAAIDAESTIRTIAQMARTWIPRARIVETIAACGGGTGAAPLAPGDVSPRAELRRQAEALLAYVDALSGVRP